ncbi:MAG: TetR/AcrR family transcriptional regulator [Solirubrobacterales bacterium]|nr:TetR/AcrR family transcriptional regulator [Solirubrobacterales bacterium]
MTDSEGALALPTRTPRRLPRGQNALPRTVVAATQRRRLCEAAALVVAEKSFGGTNVSDIVRAAGVSKTAFYEHFENKAECLLAAYEEGIDEHFQAVIAAAARADGDRLDRFRASVRAYLDGLSQHPEYARVFVLEIHAVGPEAAVRRERAQRQYVDLMRSSYESFRRHRPGLGLLPDEVFAAAVTAGNELIAERIRRGGVKELGSLQGLIMYTYLALMGMPEEARAELGGTR